MNEGVLWFKFKTFGMNPVSHFKKLLTFSMESLYNVKMALLPLFSRNHCKKSPEI